MPDKQKPAVDRTDPKPTQHPAKTTSRDDTSKTRVDTKANARFVTDGGREIRRYQSIASTEKEVRNYAAGNDRLYAYRTDNDTQHIVVARGSNPNEQWERLVPATRDRVVPGQTLWTIPDNWEDRVVSFQSPTNRTLFYVSESETWVEISVPNNPQINEALYSVEAVGTLRLDLAGDLGSKDEINDFADEIESPEKPINAYAASIRSVAQHRDVIAERLNAMLDSRLSELLATTAMEGDLIRVDSNWTYERREPIIYPEELLWECYVPHPTPIEQLVSDLRNEDLLPNLRRPKFLLDDTDLGSKYYINALTEAKCLEESATDYYMTCVRGFSEEQWAEYRGVDESTIRTSVECVKNYIDCTHGGTKP